MNFHSLVIAGLILSSCLAGAASEYNQPPKEILDIMQAPATPYPMMSPTEDRIMLVTMQEYPSIERVAEPFLRLAGVRLQPKNYSKHDTPGGYGIPSCARGYSIVTVADGSEKNVDISKLACTDRPVWARDGKRFFFRNKTKDAVELWIGDAKTAKIARVPGVKLNQMFGDDARWMPDQKRISVKLVPKKLGPAPKLEGSSIGPVIQESTGEKGQSSTYEKRDTLNNKNDEKLFDYYGLSQLAIVDVESKKLTLIDKPALYDDVLTAPDGVHVFTRTIVRPYSYIVTYSRFPSKVEVLNISNPKKITRALIADIPLADRVPIHGEPLGPRDFSWRPHGGATLIWAEALDGGDWNVKVPARDKIMTLSAPFTAAPMEVFKTEQRYNGFRWLENKEIALLSEYDHNKHWNRTFIVNFDNPKQEKKILWDLSSDELYADPGQPVLRTLSNGFAVIRQDKNSIFLDGYGSSPEGDRPFLDKLDLTSLKTERLFQSGKTSYEYFLSFPGEDERNILTWYQTPDDVPNVYRRVLGVESKTALTKIKDPVPQVRQIKKRLVKYKRADGVDLSFTLYTPPGYKEGTRVPTILYAYPLDYADASKAGQVQGSEYTFTRLRGYRLLLMAGYAIIDRASFPIVGDPKKAYDTYTDQLVADAKAAVDEAVRLGVADPERIGVTGHSHGALMTVNLLAHTNLFKAGVATSGSYNKTLTPFGFQNERRTVWEAPDVYKKVSPFFYADKLKTPLLLVHGADDANPGTTPMQASFLYEAIRGNGGKVRLVMLPHEPHWYTARETNEQQIYEMLSWFDKYVKNAPTQSKSNQEVSSK
ncbi:alpha/beta hydrolase family protein [Bdellovibrio sp. HCB2-146]|uniref:alpha/beta hydrolase family protein n=1 Tax=Bdellovibrio sp. HCB2-146 TaxID=3394362 RepID=UPI0039BC563E